MAWDDDQLEVMVHGDSILGNEIENEKRICMHISINDMYFFNISTISVNFIVIITSWLECIKVYWSLAVMLYNQLLWLYRAKAGPEKIFMNELNSSFI